MRNKFDMQLKELHTELIKMGSLCEKAINLAVSAIKDKDSNKIAEVHTCEKTLDAMEREIESLAMKMLIHQQPVAGDLRVISAALRMISDMERIGDQAADIAEISEYIIARDMPEEKNILLMAAEAGRMVTCAIDSFVRGDGMLACKVAEYDDIVDCWFAEIKSELIAAIARDGKNGEYYLDLFMIAKYLERIGDHAENISEWVSYSVTGEHI